MTNLKIAWLAGILDGEGCLYARFVSGRRTSVEIRVDIQVTSTRMIEEVALIYDILGVEYAKEIGRMQPLSTRPAHKISVRRKAEVQKLLNAVIPFLKVKDKEAMLMRDYVEKFPDERGRGRVRSLQEERDALVTQVCDLKKVA